MVLMNIAFEVEGSRKKTKSCIRAATIMYLILFPFLFMFAIATVMVFDSPSMTVPFGLSIIFLFFCVPLSIPFTIYLVWSRYAQGKYKKSRQFCLLPLYIGVIAFVCNAVIDTIIH